MMAVRERGYPRTPMSCERDSSVEGHHEGSSPRAANTKNVTLLDPTALLQGSETTMSPGSSLVLPLPRAIKVRLPDPVSMVVPVITVMLLSLSCSDAAYGSFGPVRFLDTHPAPRTEARCSRSARQNVYAPRASGPHRSCVSSPERRTLLPPERVLPNLHLLHLERSILARKEQQRFTFLVIQVLDLSDIESMVPGGVGIDYSANKLRNCSLD
jgi:hypothetical protein